MSVHAECRSSCCEVLRKDDSGEQGGGEILGGEAEVGGHLHCVVTAAEQQEAEGQCDDHTHHCSHGDVGQGMGGEARLQPASVGEGEI